MRLGFGRDNVPCTEAISVYSAGSIKKQVAFLKAMFDFGFHEFEHAGVNPWGRLKVVVPEDGDENGVSFDYAEVRTLLSRVSTINDDLQDIIRKRRPQATALKSCFRWAHGNSASMSRLG